MLTTALHNLRYAARQLLAQPAFTVFAVASLAIGMAASITVFSAANRFLFAPLEGIGHPDRLVELAGLRHGNRVDSFSAPDFNDYAVRAKNVADVFAYRHEWINVDFSGEPQRTFGLTVSGNYFDALEVPAYRGRLIKRDDDRDGAAPVAVASYAGWRKYLAGDETVIGKVVSINGHSFTLIGVSAPQFRGTIAALTPSFYVPLAQQPLIKASEAHLRDQRASMWLSLGARLADSTTMAAAQQQLSSVAAELAKEYPRHGNEGGMAISATPLRGVPGEFRGGLIAFSSLLFTMTSLLLLVACVNVASMLLARGENRRHEIAMRFVLGASRARVMWQLLSESLLLSLAAGGVGVALSIVACRLLSSIDPPIPIPLSIRIPIDAAALWFALACTVVTALAFGLLPALRVSGSAPAAGAALSGSRTASRRTRLGGALVVAQIALTMILLVGGGLFMRAMQRAIAIDPGFEAHDVLTADFNLEPSGYALPKQLELQNAMVERVRAIPGVDHAAIAALVPLDFSRMSEGDFQVHGTSTEDLSPFSNLVSPGYFQTLGIPLQGRDFDAHDVKSAPGVGVVNATLAHRLAPDGDVIGKSFPFGSPTDAHPLTIVGIVPDGKYASLDEDREPFLFLPLMQWPRAEASLLVKSALPANDFAARLRTQVRALDASLPAARVFPLSDILDLSLLPQRIAAWTSLALGVVGLLLAGIGLYGLIAMYVAGRTREFGVRLSVGATPSRILGEVVRRGAMLSAAGLALGSVLALGGAVLVSGILYGATPADALAFVGAALLLAAVALLASYLPARRAARTAPMAALRHE